MRRGFYLTILLAIVLPVFSLDAQTGSFLTGPQDAEAMAMGGLNAVGDAESAISVNKVDTDVSYLMWAPGGISSNIINAGISYRFGQFAVIGQGRTCAHGTYELYDENGAPAGSHAPNEFMAGLGAAYSITSDLAVSVLAKYVGSDLAPDAKGSGFCADINFIYRYKDLTLGALVSNIGSKIKYPTTTAAMPLLMKLGARYGLHFGDKSDLQMGVDAGYLSQGGHNSVLISAGGCFRALGFLSVMAGYHFSTEATLEPSYASAGLGVDISMFTLSAAYLISSTPVGNSLGITLGCTF